ncbi:MAG: hypothetical protein ACRDHE_15675, partial [Ktedonobacterales bacterium]
MPYPPAFLAIQLTFARRLAALSGQPAHDAILTKTALYRILGLDWSLDPRDPVWRRFILAAAGDDGDSDAAYSVYAERCARGLVPDYDTSRPHWGCFSYEHLPDIRVIRLHFANLDTPGYG